MSQDLFAAFGSEETTKPAKTPSSTSGSARHTPKHLNLEAILNPKLYDQVVTNSKPANVEEDDDEFGDFEDASPMDAETQATILKARMGSPLPNMEMPFFETPRSAPTTPNKPRRSSRPVSSPFKTQQAQSSRPSFSASPSSKAYASPKPVSNLPFKPKPAAPVQIPATSRSTKKTSKPVANLPFKPKPTQPDSKAEIIGAHPFAGRMDMLFDADDGDYDAGADDLNIDLANDPEAAMAYSKKLIADASAHQKPQAQTRPGKPGSKSVHAPAKSADVLFDLDNLSDNPADDDDEWGTFEGGSTEPPKPVDTKSAFPKSNVATLGMDLLGLEDTSAQWASSQSGSHNTSTKSREAPKQAPQDDDAWDDFESVAPSAAPPTSIIPALLKSTMNVAARADPTNAPLLPPTNIPPPAVLLSIFPSLISSAQATLFDTLAKLPQDQKQKLLSHQSTQQFLRGFIGISVVLAHIISGRKQRWKRDQFLAQGMRIGPAAAGGKGGMKLAGVDKSEVAKEDREVLDAVRQWRSVVGKLRSAVAGASGKSTTKLPHVPEISEQMPVKVLKPAEGGIVAPHACALCGLKREERVPKVDEEVDDSFGEWWVQGMSMHLLCKNFWDSHSEQMRSR
jgi:hypothetical protein